MLWRRAYAAVLVTALLGVASALNPVDGASSGETTPRSVAVSLLDSDVVHDLRDHGNVSASPRKLRGVRAWGCMYQCSVVDHAFDAGACFHGGCPSPEQAQSRLCTMMSFEAPISHDFIPFTNDDDCLHYIRLAKKLPYADRVSLWHQVASAHDTRRNTRRLFGDLFGDTHETTTNEYDENGKLKSSTVEKSTDHKDFYHLLEVIGFGVFAAVGCSATGWAACLGGSGILLGVGKLMLG